MTMIDTITIQIMLNYSAIINRKRFKAINQGSFSKLVNNPTKEDKRKWRYAPKLTLIYRDLVPFLKIEFSAPKVIFYDNVNELKESDFDAVVSRLRDVIEGMGIFLNKEQIKKSKVLGFHPSKNIILSSSYNSHFVIKELAKVDVSKKFDIDCKEFKNGGEVLQFYTNQHAICFYDKVRDLMKPAKRAADKDQTDKQPSLFDSLIKKVEILRIEVRLKNEKMKDLLESVGYQNTEVIFEDIFKESLCQKIIKYYWDYIFKDNLFLFDMRNSPQNILKMVLAKQKYKRTALYRIFGLVGFILCSKDDGGMSELRNAIEFYKPKNNWSKTKKWLDDFKKDLDNAYLHGFIKDIESQLNEFKPFRVKNCEKLSTCRVNKSKV